jgi:alkylation response protein AidB-like acyl-CoA dehydrogenase
VTSDARRVGEVGENRVIGSTGKRWRRASADNRVTRIYGGTSEVMKLIIAKDMGL